MLRTLRAEIERDDRIREEVLPLTREVVRLCALSVKETHRGHYDQSEELLRNAKQTMEEASTCVSRSEYVSRARLLDAAYQELSEACNLISLMKGEGLVRPEEYRIPTRPYLNGIADCIGELRRAALDCLRNGKISRGEEILSIMEDLFDELNTFDFPSALVPELRRKCDVARGLIERTRGEVTLAVLQEKLAEDIRGCKR